MHKNHHILIVSIKNDTHTNNLYKNPLHTKRFYKKPSYKPRNIHITPFHIKNNLKYLSKNMYKNHRILKNHTKNHHTLTIRMKNHRILTILIKPITY